MTEQPKHTPGPWLFDGVQIVEDARPHMRVCFLPSDHNEYATSEPNGYMIAAAPEMYDVILATACPAGGWNGMPDRLEGVCTVNDCLSHGTCGCELGDVIKKARGER